jgi:2-polyprenyl-3-methyl-5-hydroxy-6-metoxy-1,4-benzoquinol methylase
MSDVFNEREWCEKYNQINLAAVSDEQWKEACSAWLANPLQLGMHHPNIDCYGEQKYLQILRMAEEGTVRFLDAGGGYGWTAAALHCSNPHIVSTSLEPSAISTSRGEQLFVRDMHIPVQFVSGTLEHYEAAPESFDAINATEVIEHVQDPCVFLEKVKSLLRPGGIFVGDTPVEGFANGAGHIHYFEQPELIKLQGHGEIKDVSGTHWNLRELLSRYFAEVEIWWVQTGPLYFNKFFVWQCRNAV